MVFPTCKLSIISVLARVAGRSARRMPGFAVCLFLLLAGVAACSDGASWHETEITGAMPDLSFTLTRAEDGKDVTGDDYDGKVALLYFGYTFCPDVCPTTLANVAQILSGLGDEADDARVLFVTVDPNRDTPKVLNEYTDAFAPQVDGLRGTPDQLAALARRYRVAYSVKASDDPAKYEVTHSPAIYVFDKQGKVRLLISSLGTGEPDVAGAEADLRRLIGDDGDSNWFGWLRGLI